MGLERIASVLQGVPSNYHTDIYANFMKDVAHILDDGRSMQYKSTRPLFIDILSQELDPSKPKFGDSEEIRTLRIVADHLKAAYAMLSDGIFPSNISRGYVLRRMIRRAIRHAQKCGVEGEFLCKVFPEELKRTPGFVQLQSIISNEEKAFAEMLCNGKRVLEKVFSKAKKERSFVISGKDSFRLYDTFGIPMDITQVLAEEQGFSVDTLEFERCLAAHKQKAQGFSAGHSGLNTISALSEKSFAEFTGFHQEFVGYRDLVVENTKVLGMWKNDVAKDGKAKKFNKLEYWVSINPTPFYAECGGQVGDRGTLRFRDLTQDTSTEMTVHVEDTKRFAQKVFAVLCSVPSDQVETFEYLVKQPTVQVFAQVDQKFRNGCAVHHSATHLLQSALKKVLGEHVTQAGSFVTSNRLRFDFSHFGALSLDEIAQIEKNVNGLALNSIEVEIKEMSRHEAEQSGAICNFGEKYDEVVRVVSIGGSKEFCGGTHVENSSSIFPFVILSESSVAAGIRRIEAIASIEGTKYLQTKDKALQDLAVQLETTAAKVPERVSKLQKQVKSTESFAQALIDILVDLPSNPLVSGKFLYSDQLNAQVHLIKLKNEKNSTEKSNNSSLLKLLRRRAEFLFLKSPKTTHFVLLGQNIVCRSNGKNGAHAGKMLQQAVKKFGGRGGGNAIFAQGSIPQDVSVQEFSKQIVGNME
jgi:alanyl-tRNA synthetase